MVFFMYIIHTHTHTSVSYSVWCVLCYIIEERVSRKPQTVSGGRRVGFFFFYVYRPREVLMVVVCVEGKRGRGTFWKAPANHHNCLGVWNPLTDMGRVVGRIARTLREYRKRAVVTQTGIFFSFLLSSHPIVWTPVSSFIFTILYVNVF